MASQLRYTEHKDIERLGVSAAIGESNSTKQKVTSIEISSEQTNLSPDFLMSDDQSIHLLQRWRDGDESAAAEIFERYVNRLCALARTRLSNRMKRRVEAEDIVQSVYRSFFRRAGDHYVIEKHGDLWRLLAAITINKVRGKVEFHTAKKRGIYAEESMKADKSMLHVPPEIISEEPKPDDAAVMVEELSDVLEKLDETQRTIIELSMQNQTIEQIAETIQRSERTVRRTIQKVREDLEIRLLASIQE